MHLLDRINVDSRARARRPLASSPPMSPAADELPAGTVFSLLYLDIEHFKHLDGRHGHASPCLAMLRAMQDGRDRVRIAA